MKCSVGNQSDDTCFIYPSCYLQYIDGNQVYKYLTNRRTNKCKTYPEDHNTFLILHVSQTKATKISSCGLKAVQKSL